MPISAPSLQRLIEAAILERIRLVRSPQAVAGRGRVVFSSSKNLCPAGGGASIERESSLASSLSVGFSNVARVLFATLFPGDCRICGNPLTNISRLPVCNSCLSALRRIEGALCSICGEPLASPYVLAEGEALCGLCQRAQPPYVKATAYGSYESGLRELIHLLKYDAVRPTAGVLGRMLADAIGDLQSLFAAERVVVVPVPLHARKFRQRGFNQSELIARSALKFLSGDFQLEPKALERQRETESQIGLSRHQRRENMRGAFAVTQPQAIAGCQVLLVDDVMTTGTTASECARVLKRAGASKVYVATVARTLKLEAQSAEMEVEDALVMAAHG